jgi:hypothetical protein
MSTSESTHDHNTIKKWAEKRKVIPAKIKGTGKEKDEGVSRIHFPEHSDSENFEEISREDFFTDFDKTNWTFSIKRKKQMGKLVPFINLLQGTK